MKKEQSSSKDVRQYLLDMMKKCALKNKKTKKSRRLTETDIDIFAEDEKEQKE